MYAGRSVADLFPELIKEIDPSLNDGLTAKMIPAHSNMSITWQKEYYAPDGRFFVFQWNTSPNNRIKKGKYIRECPYLTGKKVWVGYNDLATTYPDIAAEWHPTKNGDLTPQDVAPHSNKKVWWLTYAPHPIERNQKVPLEWESQVSHRTQGAGCPYLTGCAIQIGFNDLPTTHPHLIEEWDWNLNKISPQSVSKSSTKKIHWKCAHGHSWCAVIYNRTRGGGCPICRESHGEMKISKFLDQQHIHYQRQFRFKDCKFERVLPFDFCIFDKRGKIALLVEFDGEQHYNECSFGRKKRKKDSLEVIQLKDKVKTEYCFNHNYPLLRISYMEFENIETILQETLLKLNIIA